MTREIHVHINKRLESWAKARMRAQAYLYKNFEMSHDDGDNAARRGNDLLVIKGIDQAGFTAEAQADRLRSGLFAVTVVR